MTLNDKQQRFVEEYLVDLNATQATIRAGYSERTACSQGSRLLKYAGVAAAVAAARAKRSKRTKITQDMVLNELARIGFANMLDYVTVQDDGSVVVDLTDLDRGRAAAIREMVVDEYTEGRGDGARDVKRIKFKLNDKRAALVDIARHLGMFTDKIEVSGKVDAVNILLEGRKRNAERG